MARIRSIKPEFFTSETLAKVSISARLTFIGLWTYVDDNGVGLDNERLITAALYPLDDDPREALRRVSDDLMQLSSAGVITRYRVKERHFLFITNWVEHQKVQHPGKPRHPLPNFPGAVLLTSDNGRSPESLMQSSGGSPESLTPEQGAGSREETTSSSSAHADDAETASKPKAKRIKRDTADGFDAFWKVYPLKVGKIAAEKAYAKAVASGADPKAVAAAAALYAMSVRGKDREHIKHPQGWLNDGRYADELAAGTSLPAHNGANAHKPLAEALAEPDDYQGPPIYPTDEWPDLGNQFSLDD